MTHNGKDQNLDQGVIDGFGHEWAAFDYSEIGTDDALDAQFLAYCAPIELSEFNRLTSKAADFGAGSGRWTSRLLPYFSEVYALEPSDGANKVLREKFNAEPRIKILIHLIWRCRLAFSTIFRIQDWQLRMSQKKLRVVEFFYVIYTIN
jgi:hypothetical protein